MSKILAWHYTTLEKSTLIDQSGSLKPATAFVPKKERPMLWLSLNQYWEQSANKAVMVHGYRMPLDMDKTASATGGLIRYGVPQCKLDKWVKASKRANMDSMTRNALINAGEKCGANPDEWLTSFYPIPVANLRKEVFIDGAWQEAF